MQNVFESFTKKERVSLQQEIDIHKKYQEMLETEIEKKRKK